jgi:hypothetical protein
MLSSRSRMQSAQSQPSIAGTVMLRFMIESDASVSNERSQQRFLTPSVHACAISRAPGRSCLATASE